MLYCCYNKKHAVTKCNLWTLFQGGSMVYTDRMRAELPWPLSAPKSLDSTGIQVREDSGHGLLNDRVIL